MTLDRGVISEMHVCVTWLFFVLLQGILLEHREIEFGSKVNIEDVITAARRISLEPLSLEN